MLSPDGRVRGVFMVARHRILTEQRHARALRRALQHASGGKEAAGGGRDEGLPASLALGEPVGIELATDSSHPGGRLQKAQSQTGAGEELLFTPATIPAAVDTSNFATAAQFSTLQTDLNGKADLTYAAFTGNVATRGHLTVNGASQNLASDLRVYSTGQYDRGRLKFVNTNFSSWYETYQHWDGGTFKIRNKPQFASGTGNSVNTYPMYQGNQWKASIGMYRGNNNSTISKIEPYATGLIYRTGSIVSTSDDRIKSYTENVTNATATILHCEPKKYKKHENFQTDSETPDLEGVDWRWEYGLVAQDLQGHDTLRHFVNQHPDSGLYHVNYEEMIPLLLQSIKELHARIAVLEQRP